MFIIEIIHCENCCDILYCRDVEKIDVDEFLKKNPDNFFCTIDGIFCCDCVGHCAECEKPNNGMYVYCVKCLEHKKSAFVKINNSRSHFN